MRVFTYVLEKEECECSLREEVEDLFCFLNLKQPFLLVMVVPHFPCNAVTNEIMNMPLVRWALIFHWTQTHLSVLLSDSTLIFLFFFKLGTSTKNKNQQSPSSALLLSDAN